MERVHPPQRERERETKGGQEWEREELTALYGGARLWQEFSEAVEAVIQNRLGAGEERD